MANNIDPSILEWMRKQQGGSGYVSPGTMDLGGQRFQATYAPPTNYGADGIGQTQSIESILGYDPNKTQTGDSFNVYNPDGSFSNQSQFKPDRSMQDLMMFLAAAGGMYGLANMGAIPSMGAESAAGGVGQTLGKAALDGTTAFGANSAPGAFDLTTLAGSGPQTMPMLELMNPALEVGPNLTPMALSGAGAAAGGAAGSALGSGAGGAGASLIPGVSNSMLGTGLTALTALSGSQGTEGQTTERKMDPRLDQYVYGPNGTMPMTASLLQQQFPMAQQGGQSLFAKGQGLLGRGIAANPFLKG